MKKNWLYPGISPAVYEMLTKMKLTIFLICITVLGGFAADSYAQTARLTLDAENATIKSILSKIESQSEFKFFYSSNVDVEQTASVSQQNKKVFDILDDLFEGTGIKYEVYGRQIALMDKGETFAFPSSGIVAQQKTVTGKVTDDTNQPLPGVTVVIKGTTQGTVTNVDGEYTIVNVPENTTLQFSFVGMRMQEVVVVGGQTIINVTLKADVIGIEEVVAVGYASQKKINLTGAVVTVNNDEIISTDANIASQLQGRVAGLTVSRDNSPGGNATVRLRGYGSINNNDPLYIIDGIPTTGGLNKINSNSVESITILKDAAASSIYGSRASNGVIIVTTKRGDKGTPKINVNSRFGIQQAINQMNLLNTSEYGELLWLEFKNQGLNHGDVGWGHLQYGSGPEPVIPDYIFPAGKMVGEVNENAYSYPIPYYGITKANKIGTNWYDEIFVIAPFHEHSISTSGGSDKSNYFLSLVYNNQKGIIDYTGFESISSVANGDFEITDWLKIGQSINFTNSFRTGISYNTEGGPVAQAYRAQPIIPVYDIAGNFAGTKSPTTGNASNPVAEIYRNKDNLNNESRILGNAYLQIDLIKGLTAKSLIGIDHNRNRNTSYTLQNIEMSEAVSTDVLNESYSGGFQYNWANTLNFSKKFNEVHDINILLGTELVNYKWDWINGSRSSYAFTDIDYMVLDAGESGQTSGGSFDAWKTFSYFGRLNYIFQEKYLFEGVFRRDASSRFSELNRWGTFPAFSAGWILSQEKFMSNFGWIDLLKLRVGYGMNGNDNVGNYNIYNTFRSNGYESYYNIQGESNNSTQAGFYKYRLGNVSAKWESTTTTNLGIDFLGFNNKLGFNLELFNRKTSDMLYPETKPSTYGNVVFPSINVGEMRNKGFDLTLSFNDELNKDFKYNISANLSHYSNEIISLNGNNQEMLYGSTIRNAFFTVSKAGEPISSFYGYVAEGIFNTQEEVNNWPKYNPDINGNDNYGMPGVLKYKDVSGDGVITSEDRTFIGSPHPDFTYGLNLDFQYKNWDLTAFFQGVYGNNLINYGKRVTDFKHFSNNRSKARLYESWTTERYANGVKITLPIALEGERDVIMQNPSSFFIEDGSYFRMKELQIGYSLPEKTMEKLNIKNVRLYFQTTNLFTLSKYSGLDPEINPSSDRQIGVDIGIYPTSKMFMFGVDFNL